jgi:mycothiol synthase
MKIHKCKKRGKPALAAMLDGARYEEHLDSKRLVVAESDGALAGFACASPFSGDCRVFVFVAPEFRRQGIGTMLYAWAERQARRARCKGLWSTYYDREESEGFVRKIGYDRLTGNDYMRCAGDLLPEKDFAIRNYADSDFDRVFFITSHAWHDLRLRTGVTDSKVHEESREIRRSYRRHADTGYVLEDNGQLVAYGSFGGDMIGSVCVDPALYNRGYGRAMAIFLTNEILRRKNGAAYLWCEHGNDNARHIYESLGYETQYTGWSPIKKL